jgi:hypothetical protein
MMGSGRPRMIATTSGIAMTFGPVIAQTLPEASGPIEVFTIAGQVTDFYGGAFTLRHTRGVIELTFDGWPSSREAGQPIVDIGDNVTVSVEMNDAFVDGGDASVVSVYSEDSQTFSTFGLPAAGDGSATRPLVSPFDVVGDRGDATLSGTITQVLAEGFVLAAGAAEVDVDTSALFYDPYDTIGGQRLEVGDLVAVSGLIAPRFPQDAAFSAEQVVEVHLVTYGG